MRRLVIIPVVLIAVAAAFVTAGASDGSGALRTYEIELDNAFGLVEGGDLKIGGVKAGQTSGFEITKRQPCVVVRFTGRPWVRRRKVE